MQLLRRIANSTEKLYPLIGTTELAEARIYEDRGWVVIKQTKIQKGLLTYGQQDSYAQITDLGLRALT